MGDIRFRVLKDMTWDGERLEAGDAVQIAEGHPRLGIENWRKRFLAYDAAETPEPSKPKKQTAKAGRN